jgi:hypothetical protein
MSIRRSPARIRRISSRRRQVEQPPHSHMAYSPSTRILSPDFHGHWGVGTTALLTML